MSLFKDNLLIREIPKRFLAEGETGRVRFKRLNSEKLRRANEAQTFAMLDQAEAIRTHLSKDARALSEKYAESDAVAKAKAEAVQPRGRKPEVAKETFSDFHNPKLVELAHPEFSVNAGSWTELGSDDLIEDLPCLDWLAGEIYDESRSDDEEAREKNS